MVEGFLWRLVIQTSPNLKPNIPTLPGTRTQTYTVQLPISYRIFIQQLQPPHGLLIKMPRQNLIVIDPPSGTRSIGNLAFPIHSTAHRDHIAESVRLNKTARLHKFDTFLNRKSQASGLCYPIYTVHFIILDVGRVISY